MRRSGPRAQHYTLEPAAGQNEPGWASVPASLRRDGETYLAGGVRISGAQLSAILLLRECDVIGNSDMHEHVFLGGNCKEQKTKQVKQQMRLIIMQDHYWMVGLIFVVCALYRVLSHLQVLGFSIQMPNSLIFTHLYW